MFLGADSMSILLRSSADPVSVPLVGAFRKVWTSCFHFFSLCIEIPQVSEVIDLSFVTVVDEKYLWRNY